MSEFTDTAQAGLKELEGAKILAVEERDGGSEDVDGDSCLWHFLVFVTDKGHVTFDWRNRSNGYYDGEVVLNFRSAAKNEVPA